eukprot:scaffold4450_cov113-Isochrysis_galbana.AAC.2
MCSTQQSNTVKAPHDVTRRARVHNKYTNTQEIEQRSLTHPYHPPTNTQAARSSSSSSVFGLRHQHRSDASTSTLKTQTTDKTDHKAGWQEQSRSKTRGKGSSGCSAPLAKLVAKTTDSELGSGRLGACVECCITHKRKQQRIALKARHTAFCILSATRCQG